MTVEQMEDAGFYRDSPKLYPHRWNMSSNYGELSFNMPFLAGEDIRSLVEHGFESGLAYGIEKGKQQKAKEIKDALYLP